MGGWVNLWCLIIVFLSFLLVLFLPNFISYLLSFFLSCVISYFQGLLVGFYWPWLYNPDVFWNNRFVIPQRRNKFSLNLWMSWCFFLRCQSEKLLLLVLFDVVNWKIGLSGIYLYNAIVLFLAVFFYYFLFFLVYNVATFVTSGYLDNKSIVLFSRMKKFIVFCHASLPSKKYWSNSLCYRWL